MKSFANNIFYTLFPWVGGIETPPDGGPGLDLEFLFGQKRLRSRELMFLDAALGLCVFCVL